MSLYMSGTVRASVETLKKPASVRARPALGVRLPVSYCAIRTSAERSGNAEVPETGRVLVATPATYALMKKCKDITMETDIGNDLRLKGVFGILDVMTAQKIPANRLPDGFGFLIAHPCANSIRKRKKKTA